MQVLCRINFTWILNHPSLDIVHTQKLPNQRTHVYQDNLFVFYVYYNAYLSNHRRRRHHHHHHHYHPYAADNIHLISAHLREERSLKS